MKHHTTVARAAQQERITWILQDLARRAFQASSRAIAMTPDMIGTPVASHRISLHPAALTSKKPNPHPINPAIVLFIKFIFTEPLPDCVHGYLPPQIGQ